MMALVILSKLCKVLRNNDPLTTILFYIAVDMLAILVASIVLKNPDFLRTSTMRRGGSPLWFDKRLMQVKFSGHLEGGERWLGGLGLQVFECYGKDVAVSIFFPFQFLACESFYLL